MSIPCNVGVQIPRILLPRPGIDLTRWAVIACDQFTSQPEYWDQVENLVSDGPSTYRLVLPEVYLGTPEEPKRVAAIRAAMTSYLKGGIFQECSGMIYVERVLDGKVRKGLLLCLDLECYDFNRGSRSLIRATEGTILERLPPRMKIREGAPLELPHILVLIDDPDCTVIVPVEEQKTRLPVAYDFELMQGSGRLRGYRVTDPVLESNVIGALQDLADPAVFASKYQVDSSKDILLFAVGDGNHSLATAKSIWEKIKATAGPDHPARYALVEIENVHDDGLEFEPIHRVLFEVRSDFLKALEQYYPGCVRYHQAATCEEMIACVDAQTGPSHQIGMITPSGCGILEISQPPANLPVGTLQAFLDGFLIENGAGKIDYVHGKDIVIQLGRQPGNTGFYLPAMDKSQLFRTVILDGALPRKTFSMGDAHEKRFYLEARKII